MLATIITLGETMLADITAYVGDLYTDIETLVILCIGLPLAFWFVGKVIALVRGGFRTRSSRA